MPWVQVIKTMLQLNQAIQKVINGVTRYIEGWRRHSQLWKTDKAAVLDKFKAREPSCAEFEEKLAKYTKVGPRGLAHATCPKPHVPPLTHATCATHATCPSRIHYCLGGFLNTAFQRMAPMAMN